MGLTSSISGASQNVLSAIKKASDKIGVDFDYLVNQARTESSFNPNAKARTSSATGLYQFIDQTWLSTVSKHGSKHGLGDLSSQIQKDFQGRYFVSDDTVKDQIMTLRTDPEIASIMAAEFASDNQNYLEAKTGKDANATDLYFAHFLGAGGASKFINAMQDDPSLSAASLFPSAASANKNIFYNSNGSPKNLNEIYNNFERKFASITTDHTTSNEPLTANTNTYQRDISFERMYGNEIAYFVRDLPSIDGFQTQSFFGDLLSNMTRETVQNQIIDYTSFLTLTMLDAPK